MTGRVLGEVETIIQLRRGVIGRGTYGSFANDD